MSATERRRRVDIGESTVELYRPGEWSDYDDFTDDLDDDPTPLRFIPPEPPEPLETQVGAALDAWEAHAAEVRARSAELATRAREAKRINYTRPDPRNPTLKSDRVPPDPRELLGPTGFDDPF